MKIENKKVVKLSYKLRNDGFESQIVEQTSDNNPLEFIYGIGMMLPKFEENLNDKKIGDKFKFKLEPADGYGVSDPKNIINLPKTTFEVDGKIDDNVVKIGNVIGMQDGSGRRFNGMVKEISADMVLMDFNHPMAGKDLYFEGEIIDVRDATQDELDHGHIHHGGGNCGHGDCGGHGHGHGHGYGHDDGHCCGGGGCHH